jgi:hypothetical protein
MLHTIKACVVGLAVIGRLIVPVTVLAGISNLQQLQCLGQAKTIADPLTAGQGFTSCGVCCICAALSPDCPW